MRWLFSILFALMTSSLVAGDGGADRVISIWDNSTAPHSNLLTGEGYKAEAETRSDITEAKLYIFEAKPRRSTLSMVVCPGGGYSRVALTREGFKRAEWLNSLGYTVGVLEYRLPNGVRQVPLEDAKRALEIMRELSSELGTDPERVGMLGSSAGGYLTASASTLLEEEERPCFAVLRYPAISSRGTIDVEGGLFEKLLGKDRTEAESENYSLDRRVSSTTPPTLLLHSDNDSLVSPVGSTLYYNALKAEGIPASIHIYPHGGWRGHGIGEEYVEDSNQKIAEWLEWFDNEYTK